MDPSWIVHVLEVGYVLMLGYAAGVASVVLGLKVYSWHLQRQLDRMQAELAGIAVDHRVALRKQSALRERLALEAATRALRNGEPEAW